MEKKQTLRTWRRFKDLSQQELADKIGVSNITISNYENDGIQNAKFSNIVAILRVLDINFNQLDVK